MQKKPSTLAPLIERYKKWKKEQVEDSTDSEEHDSKASNLPNFEFDDDDEPAKTPTEKKHPAEKKTEHSTPVPVSAEKREKSDRRRREKSERGEKGAERKKREKSSRSKKKKTKPSALTSIIYPSLDKLSETDDDRLVAALEHLRGTFDKAERLHPGISHALIAQIIDTLKRSAQ